MFEEIWVPIEGFEMYKISNHGRITKRDGSIKTLILTKRGYLKTNFWLNNKSYCYQVSRLVAKHFNEDWDEKLEVDHLGAKTDNRSWMIQMVTRQENELKEQRRNNKKRGARLIRNRWESRICINNKFIVLGYFATKEDAQEMYRIKYLELYKQEPWYVNEYNKKE